MVAFTKIFKEILNYKFNRWYDTLYPHFGKQETRCLRGIKEAIQNIYFLYDDLTGLAFKFSLLTLIKKTWPVPSSLLQS